jgi:hypothetical protein
MTGSVKIYHISIRRGAGYVVNCKERRKGQITLVVAIVIILVSSLSARVQITNANSAESKSVIPIASASKYKAGVLKVTEKSSLVLKCDKADVSIYCWKNPEIRFEAKETIIGRQDRDKLPEELERFKTEIFANNKEKTTVISSSFDNKGWPEDYAVKLSIYVPRSISSIKGAVNNGSISVMDDVDCDIDLTGSGLDININSIRGSAACNVSKGNISIRGGHITGKLAIDTLEGNISIRSKFDDPAACSIKTGAGFIDMMVPKEQDMSECSLYSSTGMVRVSTY